MREPLAGHSAARSADARRMLILVHCRHPQLAPQLRSRRCRWPLALHCAVTREEDRRGSVKRGGHSARTAGSLRSATCCDVTTFGCLFAVWAVLGAVWCGSGGERWSWLASIHTVFTLGEGGATVARPFTDDHLRSIGNTRRRWTGHVDTHLAQQVEVTPGFPHATHMLRGDACNNKAEGGGEQQRLAGGN